MKRRKSKFDSLIKLIMCGWRPYEGEATAVVYDRLGCQRRGSARWFARNDVLTCIACDEYCTLARPEGFQLPLLTYPHPLDGIRLTPDELMAKRRFLKMHEAAYVLNVSRSKVYKLCKEGRLRVAEGKPRRVPVEDVRALLKNIDWWEGDDEKDVTAS